VSDLALPLLVAILVALLGVGALGAFLPGSSRQPIGFVATGICGLGCLLSLISVLVSASPTITDLPVGPPGMRLHLALDPLSGFFLLFMFLAGAAVLACAAEGADADPLAGLTARIAGCIAGLGLTLLAADGVTLALGLTIGGGALWATSEPGPPRAQHIAVVLAAAALLLTAVALLTAPDSLPHFEAIRARTPDPRPAAAALTLLGAGALAGLFPLGTSPLRPRLTPLHATVPTCAVALLSGGMMPVGTYLLLRLAVDLAGRSPPSWWGLPFLLMGAASAVIGGWCSATRMQLDTILADGSRRLSGLAAIGIGLVLFARAADLPNLAGFGISAVLLLSAGQTICATLVLLTAGVVQQEAGTRRLDRLGGLIHRMPTAAIAMSIGLFGLANLPPGVGFAGSWLLFQALLAAPRAGGLAPQILLAGLSATLAVSGALGAASAVRLFGIAFLGRPRTPRTAAANDITGRPRSALLILAAVAALLGLLPGVVLRVLAEPAVSLLTGTGLGFRAGLLSLAPGSGSPGYAVLPLVALGALCGGATLWGLRRGGRGERTSPAWHDGFSPPPAWLPFGDPLAQSDGSGFVPELPRLPDPRPLLARSLLSWPTPNWSSIARAVSFHAMALWVVLIVIATLLALLTALAAK
jgi:formate hydrogenlyase subunit 3/multisubunit Na+/H+ antiporter MnhD subunit